MALMAEKAKFETIYTDVLVVGGGGAGLRAAIEASKQGAKTLIITKEPFGTTTTNMATGGIDAAVAGASVKQHFEDTITAGLSINNHRLAKILAEEMPQRIADLISYGVVFDKLPDGSFYSWTGGKQSQALTLSAGDYIGSEMMRALTAQVRRLNIICLSRHFVARLLTDKKRAAGAFVLDEKGQFKVIVAKSIILATGGAGQLYLTTSNPPGATGDGYGLAAQVGAELIDMEFIQFHPTGIAYPLMKKGALVTEKARGHGAILINKNGQRFVNELAGRDELSRAIYREISEGRGTSHGGVFLDVTHWQKGMAEKIIPAVFRQFMAMGVDIRKQPMEVAPTAHHLMGGVRINEWGETNVRGLFACSEAAGGVHGANRLVGNALSEGQVFGARAGLRSAIFAKKAKFSSVPLGQVNSEIKRIESFQKRKRGKQAEELLGQLKKLMWEGVGIIRSKKGLQKAQRELAVLKKQAAKMSAGDISQLKISLSLLKMLQTAEIIIKAALVRTESRGAHFREDFPQMEKSWQKNIVLYQENGRLKTKLLKVVKGIDREVNTK